ncbi:MAG: hypothetical protein ACM3KR_09870 [Deltaproteobacteria bacterium]
MKKRIGILALGLLFLLIIFILIVFPNSNVNSNKITNMITKTNIVKKVQINSINTNIINEIRHNPEKINKVFFSVKQELKSTLGSSFSNLTDDELRIIFAGIISYQLAPYGSSKNLEFNKILVEKKLSCDKYAIAVGYFSRIFNIKNNSIRFVGWHGGIIGNHAQLFVENNKTSTSIMIDPTIAVIALASFDEIASGEPIPAEKIVDFSTRTELNSFEGKVIEALLKGDYKPSDMLYYFEDLEHFLKGSITSDKDWPPNWMTPGAMKLRQDINKLKNLK